MQLEIREGLMGVPIAILRSRQLSKPFASANFAYKTLVWNLHVSFYWSSQQQELWCVHAHADITTQASLEQMVHADLRGHPEEGHVLVILSEHAVTNCWWSVKWRWPPKENASF